MEKKNLRLRAVLSFVILGAGILISYQNCMQMGNQDLASNTSLAEKAPFAYDVKLDTYSFMSCDKLVNPDTRAYFSVRAGALETGSGVGLSDAFRTYAYANKVNLTQEELWLNENQFTRDAVLQMSVRAKAYLQGSPAGPSGYPDTVRVTRIWSSLSTPTLSTALVNLAANERLRSFNGQYLVGQVAFNKAPMESAQKVLRDDGVFVAGFQGAYFTSGTDTTTRLISPYDITANPLLRNSVFGRGYLPVFASPTFQRTGSPYYLPNSSKVLLEVTEREVKDGSGAGTRLGNWACPREAQYVIIPKGQNTSDQTKLSYCNAAPDLSNLTDRQTKAYNAARKLLNSIAGEWIIDQKNNCIIRAKDEQAGFNTCYDPSVPINWTTDPTKGCTTDPVTQQPTQCAHYFSVCASYLDP